MKDNKYKNLVIEDYADIPEMLKGFNSKVAEMLHKRDEIDRVCIYAKSPFINKVFKVLIQKWNIGLIDFARGYFDNDYQSVYCLSVTYDGFLNIEKAYNAEGYPYGTDGIAFLYEEDVTQDLIDSTLFDGTKAILFGFDELKDKKPEASSKTDKFKSDAKKKTTDIDLIIERDKEEENIYGFEFSQSCDGISSYCKVRATSPLSNSEIIDIMRQMGF